MPRHGENIKRNATGRWEVEFKVKSTVAGPDGPIAKWRTRSRTFDSYDDAVEFKADVKKASARGEVWKDQRTIAVVTLCTVADAFVEAARNAALATYRFRKSMMNTFIDWAGGERPISDLSVQLLREYAASLPGEGRQATTRHRKVLEVERMWQWAWKAENRAKFLGVSEPMRVTGTEVDAVQAPAPVVRTAAPTIEDVDAMRAELRRGWRHGEDHARVALLIRYTGIRISQAVNLMWRDIVIRASGAGHLVLRQKAVGAKKGRTRVVPLHPALVADMLTWGLREGRIFKGDNDRWCRGEATREAFRTAWIASGVDRSKWDAPEDGEERGRGSPCHAIRAAVLNHLLASGVPLDHAQYLIGHASSATHAAYVPEASPAVSPWWPFLVSAVAKIPRHERPADRESPASVMETSPSRQRTSAHELEPVDDDDDNPWLRLA